MKVRFTIFALFFYFQLLAGYSQSPQFVIGGTVQDPEGSLLPGATVSLLPSGTALAASVLTEATGEFKLVVPAPGTYQFRVEDEGFAPYVGSALVNSSSPKTTLQIALKLATATQTVEVTADTLAAETTSTQLGESLDTKKIESVPLNGRNFTDLMAVQPGIVPAEHRAARRRHHERRCDHASFGGRQPRCSFHQRPARNLQRLSR